jgi:HEPN domain-containing protein
MSKNKRPLLVDEWLRFAQEDLDCAIETLSRKVFFHQTRLLCQQSAEKYLKAYILSIQIPFKKIHDLVLLSKLCASNNPLFESLLEECETLNPYITLGRYPGDLPFESINANDAELALDAAKRIALFVKKIID